MIEDETSLTGHVPLHVFKDYFKKIGSKFFIIYLFANAAEQALHAGGIVWLGNWSDSSNANATSANDDSSYRLGNYSITLLMYHTELFKFEMLYKTL